VVVDSTAHTDPRIERLLAGEHGWRQLLASVPDYVMAMDRDLTIHFHNLALDEAAKARILGTSALQWIDAAHHAAIVDAVERVFATGETVTYEVMGQGPEPSREYWYLSSAGPVRDEDGEIRLAAVITRDITDRREVEAQLEEALVRAQELDDLKSEFVAKVVHDLRTPITIVQGFAQTLDEHWNSFGEAQKLQFLQLITAGSNRLVRLVDDIMFVARIDSSALNYVDEAFDLAQLVASVTEELTLSREDAQVEVTTMPEVVGVHGDELRYRQVLTNLLSNALRFSPAGVPVEVSIELGEDRASVGVRDHGPGISARDQTRLFQRFSQVGEPTSEGNGLGLFISRSIVEDQGGSLTVDSAVGEGALFTFTVPLAGVPA
jgi:PAS domain S-box-containing protein